MLKFSRGSTFWIVLVVAAFLPATLLATKQLHAAKITKNGAGAGSATVVVRPTGYEYMVRSQNRPNQVITGAVLTSTTGTWANPIVLCDSTNEFPEDDCTYDATGNLDIEGALGSAHLIGAGVSGRQFNDALKLGQLQVVLSDGSAGTFERLL